MKLHLWFEPTFHFDFSLIRHRVGFCGDFSFLLSRQLGFSLHFSPFWRRYLAAVSPFFHLTLSFPFSAAVSPFSSLVIVKLSFFGQNVMWKNAHFLSTFLFINLLGGNVEKSFSPAQFWFELQLRREGFLTWSSQRVARILCPFSPHHLGFGQLSRFVKLFRLQDCKNSSLSLCFWSVSFNAWLN